MSIGIATLGMFNPPLETINVTSGGIVKEREEVKPKILIKNIEFKNKIKDKIKEDFITIKSIN